MKFSITDFFSKCDQKTADLVTFTEEIRNEKLHFLCSAISKTHDRYESYEASFIFRIHMQKLLCSFSVDLKSAFVAVRHSK